ncbi:hypothetical protein KJ708_05935, partial [bacterium]|nr:hypothetical protein [bacterium]
DVEATEDVVAIDVLADDKIKYRVENTFLGNRLFFYLQQTVEIQGIVTIREDGSQSIEVRKYKIIDEK